MGMKAISFSEHALFESFISSIDTVLLQNELSVFHKIIIDYLIGLLLINMSYYIERIQKPNENCGFKVGCNVQLKKL